MPFAVMAHLPMVLDETGKKYRSACTARMSSIARRRLFARSLDNYVALLGWTPEEPNRELFSAKSGRGLHD